MYTASGQTAGDDLVTRYAPLVKRIAYHLIARLPSSVQVEDLMQAGMIGLLDAANHYDERQGASFETYAGIRIRGAMIDELRRNDWAPKSVHRKARELEEAITRVEQRTGRDASDSEVAEVMGLSIEEYHQLLRDTSTSRMLSFDDMSGEDGGSAVDRFVGEGPVPLEALQSEQFRTGLADAIDRLPEREQLTMGLYYEKELNLREIGEILGVSESRISQILSQAHGRLRSRLRDYF